MTCNTAVFGELRTINVYVLYAMEFTEAQLDNRKRDSFSGNVRVD